MRDGWSGNCAGFDPLGQTYLNPVHALLWSSDGLLHNLDLPDGSTAVSINNRGQVVGNSGLYGFVRTEAGGARPLYPLNSDFLSVAATLNENDDVVGGSLDASFSMLSAVLWRNSKSFSVNLNDLVVENPSGLYLQLAEGINSRGEISGFASSSGDGADIPHAFLAIPVHASAATQTRSRPAHLTEGALNLLQQRMRLRRFGSR